MFGWLGIFSVALGCGSLAVLSHWTTKRRAAAGVNEFKGYWEKVSVQTFELTAWLYGVGSITAGIVALAYQFFLKN